VTVSFHFAGAPNETNGRKKEKKEGRKEEKLKQKETFLILFLLKSLLSFSPSFLLFHFFSIIYFNTVSETICEHSHIALPELTLAGVIHRNYYDVKLISDAQRNN